MTKKKVRFTSYEDEVIVKCVQEYVDNLLVAFEVAAAILRHKRVKASIAQRWYLYLSLRNENLDNPIYVCKSPEKSLVNRKVVKRGKTCKTRLIVSTK